MMHAILLKMYKENKKTLKVCFLDAMEEMCGLFFCSLSIRCNYKWPRAEGWGANQISARMST